MFVTCQWALSQKTSIFDFPQGYLLAQQVFVVFQQQFCHSPGTKVVLPKNMQHSDALLKDACLKLHSVVTEMQVS